MISSLKIETVTQMVKSLPAMEKKNKKQKQKNEVQFLVWEDPLEKGMISPSSTPAWRTPWTEEPGGVQSLL